MRIHRSKVIKNRDGYASVRCAECGWSYGPDTEYQCNQEADGHLLAMAGLDEDDD
jgi:hypothetical protein